MHTLTYITFLLLAALKPAHPSSLNYVIPNPTTTSKVMNIFIKYPDCGTPYIPLIDIKFSIITLKEKLRELFWQYFIVNFDPNNYSFNFYVHVTNVLNFLSPCVLVNLFCNKYSICTLAAGIALSPSVHLNIHFFLSHYLYHMSLHCKA